MAEVAAAAAVFIIQVRMSGLEVLAYQVKGMTVEMLLVREIVQVLAAAEAGLAVPVRMPPPITAD